MIQSLSLAFAPRFICLTLALLAALGFALALLAPATFERAMASLDRMPDELWWLLGAVLVGHFGAREAHHLRHRPAAEPPADTPVAPREAGNP